jgi:hypothetical protein
MPNAGAWYSRSSDERGRAFAAKTWSTCRAAIEPFGLKSPTVDDP